MKKLTVIAAIAATALIVLPLTGCDNNSKSTSSAASKTTELTVYTAFESDLLSDYKKAFEKDNPDIKINWVRDSTGVITARLLAEGKDTPADVVWGLAGSSLTLLKKQGLLKSIAPANAKLLREKLKDPGANPAWYGNDAFFNAICFNTKLAKEKGIPAPTSWQDLTKPIYKGEIIMPNPASSGTGYMQVSAWLQTMGEKEGWSYMKKLDKNIAQYTHSGSKPCSQAAMGEVTVGISMAVRGAKLKSDGAPIDVIVPKNIGWDAEAIGVTSSTHKLTASMRLVEWSLSDSANALYSKSYAVVGNKNINNTPKNYPNVHASMAHIDFGVMAENRDAVLKSWGEHFNR